MNTLPDIQGLLEVAHCSDIASNFDFSLWYGGSDCGSNCCAIGNFCHKHQNDSLQIQKNISGERVSNVVMGELQNFEAVAARFNITLFEAFWLFNPTSFMAILHGPHHYNKNGNYKYSYITNDASYEVAARIRKFCYYKMHKHDILLDPKWGIKESAKKAGHINVMEKVKCQGRQVKELTAN